jgi:hypothetical protein
LIGCSPPLPLSLRTLKQPRGKLVCQQLLKQDSSTMNHNPRQPRRLKVRQQLHRSKAHRTEANQETPLGLKEI